MMPPEHAEVVHDFTAFGVSAFTTTRAFGTLAVGPGTPDAMNRWVHILSLAEKVGVRRLATASQVHGARVAVHEKEGDGWLRVAEADGHFTTRGDTAVAVTIADCVPVFIAHREGSVALLHSGWRGTVARIVEQGIAQFTKRGLGAADLHMHLGPAICGKCYEVSADVAGQLVGQPQQSSRTVDLRALIAGHARALGVRDITISPRCTKCDNDRFFSHRAGDAGRQVSVMIPTR